MAFEGLIELQLLYGNHPVLLPFTIGADFVCSGCWISADIVPRLLGQYIWLWLTSFVSVILYLLLFFSLRGNVTVDPDKWWRIKFHKAPKLTLREDQLSIGDSQPGSEARSQAMSMLLYVWAFRPLSACGRAPNFQPQVPRAVLCACRATFHQPLARLRDAKREPAATALLRRLHREHHALRAQRPGQCRALRGHEAEAVAV